MFASIKTVSDLSAVSQLSQLAGPHVSEAATSEWPYLKCLAGAASASLLAAALYSASASHHGSL